MFQGTLKGAGEASTNHEVVLARVVSADYWVFIFSKNIEKKKNIYIYMEVGKKKGMLVKVLFLSLDQC